MADVARKIQRLPGKILFIPTRGWGLQPHPGWYAYHHQLIRK